MNDQEQEIFDPSEHSHRRYNPLKQEWVLCSPHRTKRPWQGAANPPDTKKLAEYDAECYLCPRNKRAGNEENPDYRSTFVFTNDFAAVKQDLVNFPASTLPDGLSEEYANLYKAQSARGQCFVICFSPRHDLTIPQLDIDAILGVFEAWRNLYTSVSRDQPDVKYIQIFENKGSVMGCSNPHPHGQSWCLSYIPTEAQKVLSSQKEYHDSSKGKSQLLLDYAKAEIKCDSPRIVIKGQHFLALVPYWALWPFGVIICPSERHIPNIASLDENELSDLASVLKRMTTRYDNLFSCPFPYSMGIYQQPTLNDTVFGDATQLHLSFNPPLLRSASVKKFVVGFEMFGEAQRDLTAEQAAEKLRNCSEVHYKQS